MELDRGLSAGKVDQIVRLLGYYGVKTIIWGNEPNDPQTPWRDDLPTLFGILSAAAGARRQHRLEEVELSLPGLAYYGHGEYLDKMLRALREMGERGRRADSGGILPIQRVADHYYGPVEGFLPRLRRMREIMQREGAGHLKYDLTEVGTPALDSMPSRIGDRQLAEGYIPQITSLAIGSGLVDQFYYFSLLAEDDHSLASAWDGRLAKKAAYRSFVVMAKLLARVKQMVLREEPDLVRLEGTRGDGIEFAVTWSRVVGHDLWVDLPRGKRAFDALGQELREERPYQISLKPRQHPALGGPARIIIARS